MNTEQSKELKVEPGKITMEGLATAAKYGNQNAIQILALISQSQINLLNKLLEKAGELKNEGFVRTELAKDGSWKEFIPLKVIQAELKDLGGSDG